MAMFLGIDIWVWLDFRGVNGGIDHWTVCRASGTIDGRTQNAIFINNHVGLHFAPIIEFVQ